MPVHEVSRMETLTTTTANGRSATERKVVIRLAVTGEEDVALPTSALPDRKFHPESAVITVTDDESHWFDGVILTGTVRKKDGSIGTMSARREWFGFVNDDGQDRLYPMPEWLANSVLTVLDSIEWYDR